MLLSSGTITEGTKGSSECRPLAQSLPKTTLARPAGSASRPTGSDAAVSDRGGRPDVVGHADLA
jgi:hypothetical protein